jgi:hypothetical protein
LTIARERLSDDQHARVLGPLRAGDPRQEVKRPGSDDCSGYWLTASGAVVV